MAEFHLKNTIKISEVKCNYILYWDVNASMEEANATVVSTAKAKVIRRCVKFCTFQRHF